MEMPEVPERLFEAHKAWTLLNMFRPVGMGLSAIPFIDVVVYAELIGLPNKYVLFLADQIGAIDVAYRSYKQKQNE